MYMISGEPSGSNEAWDCLDRTFGTEEFSETQALDALANAGVTDYVQAFRRLINAGLVSEV